MQSYSQDLRERVLWALDRGERPSSIARCLEVSRVWVYQVRDRAQKLGKRTSFQIGGHRRSRVAEMESVLPPGSKQSQIWRCRNCAHG
jgi:transposase